MANNIYGAIALTGGTEGALDAINGALLVDKDTALAAIAGDYVRFYILDADSGLEESSPTVITPDENAGDKRWIQVAAWAILNEVSSGEHRVTNIKMDASERVVIQYESAAHP